MYAPDSCLPGSLAYLKLCKIHINCIDNYIKVTHYQLCYFLILIILYTTANKGKEYLA